MMKELLDNVNKPARYTGGEYQTPSMCKKDALKVCLCFPDIYEVGMSNLGLRILYHELNECDEIQAERCFAPWVDMADELKKHEAPLFSLETSSPLSSFDMIGFSLQYELCYTNILLMLELSKIPFYARERGEESPLIVGGGPCALNCEPVAEFFDVMIIGDGEESLPALCKLYQTCQKEGSSRVAFLKRATDIQGVYIPSLVQVEQEKNGKILGFSGAVPVKKAVIASLDKAYFPTKPLVPNMEIVHDRAVVELFRGCSRGCRFCQAGFTYRPIRERKVDTLLNQCELLLTSTGFDEISLSSLSTGDYPHLLELVRGLKPIAEREKVNFALPSMRADSFDGEFAEQSRRTSLTFAPEAGTQRLRDVINKDISQEDIENCLRKAFEKGYSTVKLYFMLGLPTESDEDVKGIGEIVRLARRLYGQYRTSRKELRISVSASTFVPKPFTPFQWEIHEGRESVQRKQSMLRDELKIKGVSFSWSDAATSELEAVFARGDRRLSTVVERAYQLGCRFDGWTEQFKPNLWAQAFTECGIDPNFYRAARAIEEVLPWDYVDAFVTKRYLQREREKAYTGEVTEDCRKGCKGCGANQDGTCEVARREGEKC